MSGLFRLTDAQMARLEAFFPKSQGQPRVDGRALSAQELDLVARMIFAMGLETIPQPDERPGPSTSQAAA